MKPRRWIERMPLRVKDESTAVELVREHGFEVMARTGILPRIMREPVLTPVPFNQIDWGMLGVAEMWDEFHRQKREDRRRIARVKRDIECERAFAREKAAIRFAWFGPGGGGGSASEVLPRVAPRPAPSEVDLAYMRYFAPLLIAPPRVFPTVVLA